MERIWRQYLTVFLLFSSAISLFSCTKEQVAANLAAANAVQTPANSALTVDNPPTAKSIHVGDVFTYVLPSNTFSQIDLPITYTATLSDDSALPAWLSFDTSTLTFSGTAVAAGNLNVKITATTSKNESISATFAITIGTPRYYGWGMNASGQLGNGSNDAATIPVAAPHVPFDVTFTKFATGGTTSCALDSAGMAWCWGKGTSGQLGNGADVDSNLPVEVIMPTGKTFTQIAVGGFNACAIDNVGAAWCWGEGRVLADTTMNSTLGNGVAGDSNIPVAVSMPGGRTFKKIDMGYFDTCAIANDDSAWCWGSNKNGQLGNNTWNVPALSPTEIVTTAMPANSTFVDISVGTDHTCAIINDGTLWCWGNDWSCRIGHGGWVNDWWHIQQAVPMASTMPAGVSTFTDVATSGYTSCAVADSGDLYCWGQGDGGFPIGTGAYAACTPTVVTMPVGQTFNSVTGGYRSICAVAQDDQLWCFGHIAAWTDDLFGITPTLYPIPSSVFPTGFGQTSACSWANFAIMP